jgi:hypothetical protein
MMESVGPPATAVAVAAVEWERTEDGELMAVPVVPVPSGVYFSL